MTSYGTMNVVMRDARTRSGLGEDFALSMSKVVAIELSRVAFNMLLETHRGVACVTIYNIGVISSGFIYYILLLIYQIQSVSTCACFLLFCSLVFYSCAMDNTALQYASSFLVGVGYGRYFWP